MFVQHNDVNSGPCKCPAQSRRSSSTCWTLVCQDLHQMDARLSVMDGWILEVLQAQRGWLIQP